MDVLISRFHDNCVPYQTYARNLKCNLPSIKNYDEVFDLLLFTALTWLALCYFYTIISVVSLVSDKFCWYYLNQVTFVFSLDQ